MKEIAVLAGAKRLIGRGFSVGCAALRGLARRPLLSSALAVVFLGAFGLAAAAAGYWAGERELIQKVERRYVAPAMASLAARLGHVDETLEVSHRSVVTNGHLLDIRQFRIESGGYPMAWALAQAGDNIVFASRYGQLSYLDADNRLASLGINTPQRFDQLQSSGLLDDPVFEVAEVRTFDILTIETGEGLYDLYASYARYKDDCFEIAVSRTPLELTADGVRAATGLWEDVYVVNPCIAVKSVGMRFAGHEAGGRLAVLDDDTLLLSLGVFQLDNVAEGQLAGQDPATDIGKIIAISRSTGDGRVFAAGFRNPQGLVVARDGRVWETEHGPQGGDEVNLIREGANYGWPLATYGMDYMIPPRDWPFTQTPGRQDGYAAPAFAFTPSVGISNIIEPDPQEFPRWEGQLVAASLSAGSLFVLRVVDDRIVAAEPIAFGERLRDIIQLSDGRIAVASDAGDLFFVSNAERSREQPGAVSGLDRLAPPLREAGLQDPSAEVQGARYFFYACGSCHSTAGQLGIGPPLNGVVGRPVASVEGYGYSPALREHGGSWTRGALEDFIVNPQAVAPGSAMPPMPNVPELGLILRYLASTTPIPEAGG